MASLTSSDLPPSSPQQAQGTARSGTQIETYIPLYRKYRPQIFSDVVGQGAIVQTLGNAIELNRVAHAYLFCGPRGTGKTSTARIFAKSLNCEQGPTTTPCLQCASCTGIALGNALDVIEFDAASNNGVNDARELIENCQYSSMNGRFKVYIVDEVHMLTPQAFNALLKTLEEPPANVIFIFATTEAHKVLPTIVSRCQRFDFNRITTADIASRLTAIAATEQITIDSQAVQLIARHARGGMRDAVGLLDQVSVLGRGQTDRLIQRQDVSQFIGTLEEDLLLRLGRSIAERRAADLLNDVTELSNRGVEPLQLLKDLSLHFRNLLVTKAAGPEVDADDLALPADYVVALHEQAALFPEPEELPQLLGRLASVERNVRHNAHPQLWLEVGLLELAYRHEMALVRSLSDRVSQLENALQNGGSSIGSIPASAPTRAPAATAPPPRQTLPASPAVNAPPQPLAHTPPTSQPAPSNQTQAPAAYIAAPVPSLPATGTLTAYGAPVSDADYKRLCAAIPSVPLRSLFSQQAFPLGMNGDILSIGVIGEPNITTAKNPNRFIHLEKAAEKCYGRPIKIDLILEKQRPNGNAAPAIPAPVITTPPPPLGQGQKSGLETSPGLQRAPETETSPVQQAGQSAFLKSPALPLPPLQNMSQPPQGYSPPAPGPTAVTPSASAAETTLGSRPPAMTAMYTSKPIDFSAPPPTQEVAPVAGEEQIGLTGIAPAPPLWQEDEPPPMAFGEPPADYTAPADDDDEDGMPAEPAGASMPPSFISIDPNAATDPALREAQQHALQLLQGKVLD